MRLHWLRASLLLSGPAAAAAAHGGVRGRDLMTDHGMETYGPLPCNVDANVESQSCLDSAGSLSSLVANAAASDSAVTVPCGECYVVDYVAGETVTLPHGLEVLGRLHFGPSANVTLDASHVFVQGVWGMEPPAVGNKVKIALHGTEEKTLLGNDVGKKPFVVVGGKLDIAAIDPACPSWTKLRDVVPEGSVAGGLVVGLEFASCVKAGEEVLITSHTDNGWDKHTVAKVRSVDVAGGVVYLEGSVVPADVPTEAGPSNEPRFAVEVARLNRDVVFEGRRDDSAQDGLHGAHFKILHTPDVAQTISGVVFENFGQQGVLGRYPIHFHMCDSVAGSVVSKNVIRRSNQRCVVIHGTHDARVEDNVAYDTAGHCFILEDGGETNNTFERNLGAQTKYSNHSIGSSDIDDDVGHSGVSTFWITNPSNHFIGNVAAGSQEVGFWFDTRKEVGGPSANLTENANVVPQYVDLGTFRDNVGHTNAVSGLWLYRKGWQPSSEALLENTALYKNKEGMFWHNNKNIVVRGALIADNEDGIVFFQNTPGNNRIENAEIVGMSEDTRIRHGSAPCRQASYSGLRFAWNEAELSQLDMNTVQFAGFGGIGCPALALEPFHAIVIDDDTALGSMHPSGLTFDSEENKIDVPCDMAPEGGYKNFLFEDFGGTIGPSPGQRGFIVHNEDHMKAFAGSCSDLRPGSCAAWCENVCLRRVKVETDADQDCKMVVTSDDDGTMYTYDKNTVIDRYEAVLQSGQYTFHFEDVAGNLFIPSYAHLELGEAPLCPDPVTESSIAIVRSACPDSITQADGTADSGTFGVRKLWSGAAVVDTASEGGNHYFTHTLLNSGRAGFLVELDLGCAASGKTYAFDVKYRSSSAIERRPYFSLFWRSSAGKWRSRNPIAPPSRAYASAGSGFVGGSATFTLTDEMLDPDNMFGLCVLVDWGRDVGAQADYDDILFRKV